MRNPGRNDQQSGQEPPKPYDPAAETRPDAPAETPAPNPLRYTPHAEVQAEAEAIIEEALAWARAEREAGR